jgi:hypothetical protein
MMRDAGEGAGLDAAIQRLDRALAQLEVRVEQMRAGGDGGGLFDQDRAKLAADLDAARARERDLEIAGAQASQALGRAIADIRRALGEDAAEADLDDIFDPATEEV